MNENHLIAPFLNAARDADAARTDERRAEAQKLERGLVAEAHKLATRHGITQRRHLGRVREAAGLDFDALIRAVPDGREWNATLRGYVDINHQIIRRFRTAAEAARDAVASTLGDSTQGVDIDPVNLAGAARAVEFAVTSGNTHDLATGALSESYRRAVSHLAWWIDKATKIVAGAEVAVARFDAAEKAFNEMLKRVGSPTDDAEPRTEKAALPAMDGTPPESRNASSHVDFDPREHPATWNQPKKATGTKIGKMVEPTARPGVTIVGVQEVK